MDTVIDLIKLTSLCFAVIMSAVILTLLLLSFVSWTPLTISLSTMFIVVRVSLAVSLIAAIWGIMQ